MKHIRIPLLPVVALVGLVVLPGCSRDAGRRLAASGIIEVTEVVVRSKIVGRVTALGFDEGQAVLAGHELALLATDELTAQERQALSAVATAQQQVALAGTNLKLAEDTYSRNRALYESKMLSEQAFYQIESQLKSARTQLEAARGSQAQAQAGLNLLRVQLGNATIIAPVSGTVLERNIEVGELAMAGSAICKLGDLTRAYLKIYLPEGQYGRVRLGQQVQVSADSYPGRIFTGRVATIANQAEFTPKDIQTKEERTKLVFAVKIAIDNPKAELKPGMPADATIVLE
jgi:HlyD family secretion protein